MSTGSMRAASCKAVELTPLCAKLRELWLIVNEHNEKLTVWKTCTCKRCEDIPIGNADAALHMLEGALHLASVALEQVIRGGSGSNQEGPGDD